jgi:hypothetical protein
MKEIKIITDKIKEEMEDVEEYVHLAIHNKTTDVDAYNIYMALAGEEYDHAMRLHDLAVREIGKVRKILSEKNENPPKYMLDMWNEKHEEYIETMGKLKYEIELSKSNKMM